MNKVFQGETESARVVYEDKQRITLEVTSQFSWPNTTEKKEMLNRRFPGICEDQLPKQAPIPKPESD